MNNNPQKLTPFKHFCLNIGIVPSAYIDAMTYYELLEWLCKYLQETVIPTVNNNSEVVTELQNYVNNYFENLDVQEEINAKLDSMAEDGTLTALIKNYIDPIQEAFEDQVNGEISDIENDIDTFKNSINGAITSQQTQINSIASGSPAGIYDTVEDLTTADPSHSKIYLVLADGKWYYYDTNDGWTAGGTYQSTGIADKSIKGIKTTFLNKSLNELQLEDVSETTSNGITYSCSEGVIHLSGTATSTFYININNLNTTNKTGLYRYELTNGYEYVDDKFIPHISIHGGNGAVTMGNSSKIMVPLNNTYVDRVRFRIEENAVINITIYPMLVSEKYYDIVDSTGFKSSDDELITDKIFDIGSGTIKPENTSFMTKSGNLVNPDELIDGFSNSTTRGILTFQTNPTYKTCVFYNNSSQTKRYYVYPKFRMYGELNYSSGDYGSFTNHSTEVFEPSFIDVPAYTRVNLAFYVSDLDRAMIIESNSAVPYVPYYIKISHLDVDQAHFLQNDALYNKKYVALGDSFTHGDFTNSPTNNYTIEDGLYQGQYKVYPYLIGNRTHMNVLNFGVNGMTLAYKENRPNSLIETEKYKDVPADTDYITIKIGINDDNQNIPIGSIDSDNNGTFYGAYNTVLTYLITNYPNAKIGLIATNGATVDIVNATIAIGQKYGIPVLNESTDTNVPLLIRTNRTDVPSDIKNLRNANWEVSPENNNYHPNEICHEYESTIIEHFLRSL